MKKYIIILQAICFLIIIMILGLVFVSKAEASELLFQQSPVTATTTIGTNITNYGMRFLGIDPPNWVVDRVGFYINSLNGTPLSSTWNVEFRNAAGSLVATTSAQTMTSGWNYFDYPTGASLSDFGNDMRIRVIRLTGSQQLTVSRTSTATAPPTQNYQALWNSGSADAYPVMVIYGLNLDDPTGGSVQTRIIQQNSPLNGALTSDEVVQFEFDYFNNDTDENPVLYAGVDIRDLSSGFEYIPLESDILISGVGTFSQLQSLTEGHFHMWRPYLRNASSTRIVYGQWYSFDVVSYSGEFDPLPSDGSPSATSTIFGRLFGLQGYLASRFPFAYLYDVAGLVATIDDGMVEENFPTLTLSMASSSLAMGDLEFLSKDSVEMFAGTGTVTLFRTLMSAFLWLVFAFGVYHQIRKLI